MDNKTYIINALAELGKFLNQFSSDTFQKSDSVLHNDLFFDGFKHQIKLSQEHNGWFSKTNVIFALNTWSKLLTIKNLTQWTDKYNFNVKNFKKVAIIMAGNIPLVGFHDFLCVLISGHDVLIKQSSNDEHLLPFLAKYLEHIDANLKGRILFTSDKLKDFDAVIATGSDNTARYFEYYFKDKPSIIRRNRNSVAILSGKESQKQLQALSEDIFRYYGLGCRNVSKLFVPRDYNFENFFNSIYHWNPIINEAKYANNYDYNKAVYLMSEFDMLENGFLMIKEDESYGSPIATLFYEYYDTTNNLKSKISEDINKIQCIVSEGFINSEIKFGDTQKPELWEYADNIDTIEFLLKI